MITRSMIERAAEITNAGVAYLFLDYRHLAQEFPESNVPV